jgi:hypothetical protein
MITIHTETWSWPQWAAISLIAVATFIELDLSGHQRLGTYSGLYAVARALICIAILSFGGFFG